MYFLINYEKKFLYLAKNYLNIIVFASVHFAINHGFENQFKAESELAISSKLFLISHQVALSFWKAMGGDKDEIDGLSDTSDG